MKISEFEQKLKKKKIYIHAYIQIHPRIQPFNGLSNDFAKKETCLQLQRVVNMRKQTL